jgi:outer membrane protein assembly factor BamB
MTRTLLLCTVLLAGCDRLFGTVEDRQPCAASAECPAGQTCADTGSSRICWPDPVAPVVSGVTVRCATDPCLRDGVLTVEASVTDDQEVGPVTATLDLDGGARVVPLVPVAGALHRGTVQLAEWPFPGATGTVLATVWAEDGARNVAEATAPAGQRPVVTRVRGAVGLEAGRSVMPTAPALAADGTVVVGGSTGQLYFLAPGAVAAVASSFSPPAPPILHAPTIGREAVWVSAGNLLLAVSADGSVIQNGSGYDLRSAITGPPALAAGGAPEVAFVALVGRRIAAAKADAAALDAVSFSPASDPFTAGPVLLDDATLYAVTGTASPAAATLRRFTFDGALGEGPTRAVGQAVTMPIALDAFGGAWVATSELASSALLLTRADGTPGPTIPLGANPGGSPIVLANGDVAICVGGELRRYTAAGAPVWSAPLTGAGLTPLALASPDVGATLLVPTRAGTVDALDAASGARRWSVSLTVNVELREGTVGALAGARTSTAWFTSADGLLHGLVVDGALDAAAPWPKAWHDARNSGNLAAPH